MTLLILAAAGCMEPEETPLGVEASGVDLPGDAITLILSGDDLDLSVEYWDESGYAISETDTVNVVNLTDSDILTCGGNELTGYECQPYIRFITDGDLANATGDDYGPGVLRLYLPAQPTQDARPHDGDNADYGRATVAANLWRVNAMAVIDEAETLLDLESLEGADAWRIPVAASAAGVPGFEPYVLGELGATAVLDKELYIPADSVAAWVEGGEDVILVLDWDRDAGMGTVGSVNVYSRRSTLVGADAESDSSRTAARLTVTRDNVGTTTISVEDGMLVERPPLEDHQPRVANDDVLALTTGVPNAARLRFLPSDDQLALLRDPGNIVVKATLSLYPDSTGLYNLGALDYKDNLTLGGLTSIEGGLTLDLQVGEAGDLDPDAYGDWRYLDNYLSVCEAVLFGSDSTLTTSYYNLQKDPLVLPILTWLQNVSEGSYADEGLVLKLNGARTRCRQLYYDLNPADPARAPRLEIIYVRRPDFD